MRTTTLTGASMLLENLQGRLHALGEVTDLATGQDRISELQAQVDSPDL